MPEAFRADVEDEYGVSCRAYRCVAKEPLIIGFAGLERFMDVFFEERGGYGEPSRLRRIARAPGSETSFREVVIGLASSVVVYAGIHDGGVGWERFAIGKFLAVGRIGECFTVYAFIVGVDPYSEPLEILSPIVIGVDRDYMAVFCAYDLIEIGKIIRIGHDRNDRDPEGESADQDM